LELICPEILTLCESLENDKEIPLPYVYANLYLTPPGSQSVTAHADDRDVVVLQVRVSEKKERTSKARSKARSNATTTSDATSNELRFALLAK